MLFLEGLQKGVYRGQAVSLGSHLFEVTDLQANQRGEISLQQRHNLQAYIDTQGAIFIGYLMAVGFYCIIFFGIIWGMFYQPFASVQNTLIMLMICAVVGMFTLPHATRQMFSLYQTLQNFKENQVSYVVGICQIQSIRHIPNRYLVTFADGQAVFMIDSPHIERFIRHGGTYHVYFIGGMLLSFKAV
jgi:hypothetical protein